MNRGLLYSVLFFSLFIIEAAYASSMVENHIFSPALPPEFQDKIDLTKEASPLSKKLLIELEFTGVIKSGGITKVLIRDKINKDSGTVFKKDDKIQNMTIEEIGDNYVVLSNKQEKVRLRLYCDNKQRPVSQVSSKPVPEKKVSSSINQNSNSINQNSNGLGQVSTSQNGGTAATQVQGKSPTGLPEKDVPVNENQNINNSSKTGANAFLDMIQKSQQQQQVNPEFHNKFMELINKVKNQ